MAVTCNPRSRAAASNPRACLESTGPLAGPFINLSFLKLSLNDECRPTNTNVNGPKPYDQVMFNTTYTREIDQNYDMHVVNLVEELRDNGHSTEPYPGAPYNHNAFRAAYSDHHPVVFRLTVPTNDDDQPARIASGR
ncbi:MAG: hypothetical protein HQ518_30905 [Rhodopirellula sp.]|nr:hypothetical protein [Rhodopirellula sp.]